LEEGNQGLVEGERNEDGVEGMGRREGVRMMVTDEGKDEFFDLDACSTWRCSYSDLELVTFSKSPSSSLVV
jgi:hypothetical protein